MTDYDALLERLESPCNWLRQMPGPWKDATSEYDRAPYEAAAAIRELRAEYERLRTELAEAGDLVQRIHARIKRPGAASHGLIGNLRCILDRVSDAALADAPAEPQRIATFPEYGERHPDAEPQCKCSLRTRLVGDGCAVCNPERARELAAEPRQTEDALSPDWDGESKPGGAPRDDWDA